MPLVLCTPTWAQQPAVAPVPPAKPAEEPPLGGPKVPDDALHTLVHSDMQGRFQKVEGRPEAAALGQMSIDPDRRRKAQEVVDGRAEALRQNLIDNIDLIKESTDATKAGDKATVQKLSRELYERFNAAPTPTRDPLLAPLSAVLSPEECAALKKLVDEYWSAWIDAEQRNAPKQPREAIQKRLDFEVFQAELSPAYQYTLRPFQQKLERVYQVVDPTPEQRAAIRTAVIAYIKEARLKPSEEQRRQLARAVYAALDEDRRIKLLAAALSAF